MKGGRVVHVTRMRRVFNHVSLTIGDIPKSVKGSRMYEALSDLSRQIKPALERKVSDNP